MNQSVLRAFGAHGAPQGRKRPAAHEMAAPALEEGARVGAGPAGLLMPERLASPPAFPAAWGTGWANAIHIIHNQEFFMARAQRLFIVLSTLEYHTPYRRSPFGMAAMRFPLQHEKRSRRNCPPKPKSARRKNADQGSWRVFPGQRFRLRRR
jgi:hypothetical protein